MEATSERNTKEIEEYDAETVVNYCNYYLQHASELWPISDVVDQNRLQELIFPEGIHADAFEEKRTPKFSLVYEAIKNLELAPNDVAARADRISNSIIAGTIDWYEVLKELPDFQIATARQLVAA